MWLALSRRLNIYMGVQNDFGHLTKFHQRVEVTWGGRHKHSWFEQLHRPSPANHRCFKVHQHGQCLVRFVFAHPEFNPKTVISEEDVFKLIWFSLWKTGCGVNGVESTEFTLIWLETVVWGGTSQAQTSQSRLESRRNCNTTLQPRRREPTCSKSLLRNPKRYTVIYIRPSQLHSYLSWHFAMFILPFILSHQL